MGKKKIMAINIEAIAVLRFSGGVTDWESDELKVMDRKTGKTLDGALQNELNNRWKDKKNVWNVCKRNATDYKRKYNLRMAKER